jgi:hypothetical protein
MTDHYDELSVAPDPVQAEELRQRLHARMASVSRDDHHDRSDSHLETDRLEPDKGSVPMNELSAPDTSTPNRTHGRRVLVAAAAIIVVIAAAVIAIKIEDPSRVATTVPEDARHLSMPALRSGDRARVGLRSVAVSDLGSRRVLDLLPRPLVAAASASLRRYGDRGPTDDEITCRTNAPHADLGTSSRKGSPMSADRTARSETDLRHFLWFAGPLLWAVLVLFHPMPSADNAYEGIKDDVDAWLVVHVGQLILTPFLFLAVWRLLDGLSSAAAMVSRCALVVWTVFFSAYDSVQGVATGILVDYANDLTGQEQATVAEAIEHIVKDSALAGNISFLALIAGAAWLTVAIAAAVALHQAGAGRAIVIAAVVSTVVAAHEKPAAIGFLALTVAGVLRELQRTKPSMQVHVP